MSARQPYRFTRGVLRADVVIVKNLTNHLTPAMVCLKCGTTQIVSSVPMRLQTRDEALVAAFTLASSRGVTIHDRTEMIVRIKPEPDLFTHLPIDSEKI